MQNRGVSIKSAKHYTLIFH